MPVHITSHHARGCSRRSGITCLFALTLLLAGLCTSPAAAQPADVVLQNTTITTAQTITATNSITAGPNFTIASTGNAILSAPNVAMKPRFYIINGGRLKVVSQTVVVNVKTNDAAVPQAFMVAQNYPNPFNPTTHIHYALPRAEKVTIVIYNIVGQEIKTLLSALREPGHHFVVWDGMSEAGEQASSGVYYYKVTAGKHSLTRKMTLVR